MDKTQYIKAISEQSGHYGEKLLELMEECDVCSLREVTEEQARAYYERMMAGKDGRMLLDILRAYWWFFAVIAYLCAANAAATKIPKVGQALDRLILHIERGKGR